MYLYILPCAGRGDSITVLCVLGMYLSMYVCIRRYFVACMYFRTLVQYDFTPADRLQILWQTRQPIMTNELQRHSKAVGLFLPD